MTFHREALVFDTKGTVRGNPDLIDTKIATSNARNVALALFIARSEINTWKTTKHKHERVTHDVQRQGRR
jgi:hypothetical protein